MAFDAFEVMRNRVSKVPSPTSVGEGRLDITPDNAVMLMDRFLCLIIASGYQKKSGQSVTHLHEPASKQAIADAKRAALMISQWEKKGIFAKRTFNIDTWRECVAFISTDQLQSFCESPLMHPSVLWRIILAEKAVDAQAHQIVNS